MIINNNIIKNKTEFNYNFIFPDQFVLSSKRNDPTFIKENMDYFASIAVNQFERNKRYQKNYKLYNGEFDFKDYNTNEEIKDMLSYLEDSPNEETDIPAHLKHYSIVTPPINQLKGELNTKPFKYRVKAIDDAAVNETIDFRTEVIKKHSLNNLLNRLKTGGPISPEQQQAAIQKLESEILDYTSTGEIWANKILNALKHEFKFKDKSQLSFLDFLINGKEFHHFYLDNSRLGFNYKVENPSNVWFMANKNAMTTKDCYAIGTIESLSFSELLDKYELSTDEIQHLRRKKSINGTLQDVSPLSGSLPDLNFYNDAVNNPGILDDGAFESIFYTSGLQENFTVVTAYWKGKKKIIKRTYLDEEGYQQEMFVSEDYKKGPDDIKLETKWINETLMGVKIGDEVYKEIETVEFTDGFPIVGIVNTIRNTEGKSVLELLKPYQILYNVCINQIWELYEKEIGVVFFGDIKAVPKKDSEDPIEHFLWTAKENGAVFVDTSPENTGGQMNFNQFTKLDLTRSAEISNRMELAIMLRTEAYHLIGMIPQRLGNSQASEAATVNNNSLEQSFAQTENWFAFHDTALTQAYQLALDIAQYVSLQKETSTINYLNSELENVFLQVTQSELLHEFFLFVTSFAEDKTTIDFIKNLSQAALQNGAELIEITDMISGTSERGLRKTLEEIKKRKQELEERKMKIEEQSNEVQRQNFLDEIAEKERIRVEEQQNDNLNKQLDREHEINLKNMEGISNEGAFDKENNTLDILKEQTKFALEQSKNNFDRILKKRELDIKEKEIASKERIAKVNKNKFDSKKK